MFDLHCSPADGAFQFPPSPLFIPPTSNNIHVQFNFSPETLPTLILPYIFDRGDSYGSNLQFGLKDLSDSSKGRKNVALDFSSPNIAKEFHAGHLRSTIIGAFLANLYATMGWDTVKINYLGDWGKQFGLLAVGWFKYGSEELFEQDPLAHLVDVYVKINKEFKKRRSGQGRS